MKTRFRPLRFACALLLAALVTLAAAYPPGVSYTSRTSIEMSGLAGALMKRSGMSETVTDYFVTADRMVTRTEDGRTIVDLGAETFTTVDDERRTYQVMTFDEMMAALESASEGMEDGGDQAEVAEPDQAPEAQVELDFWVDETGRRERVNGHDAELFRIHIVADVEAAEEEGGEMQDAGQFAIAMELWMSDVDGYEDVQAFHRRYAEAMGRALGVDKNMLESLAQVMGNDPRLAASLERSREEMARMEGTAVREVTHMITVPPGMEYDAALVFAETEPEPKKKRRGLGRLARRMAEQAAGIDADGDEDAVRATTQRTRMTATTDYEGFTRGMLDEAVFSVPTDYTRIERDED